MRGRLRRLALITLGLVSVLMPGAGWGQPPAGGWRDAYGQLVPGLDLARDETLAAGRQLFRHAWSPGPYRPPQEDGAGRAMDGARFLQRVGLAEEPGFNGLGPTYNRLSCAACHVKNGRGFAPESGAVPLQGMLLRLSLPGAGPHGGPRPHPAYGDQLNDHGIPGVPAEGLAFIDWEPVAVQLGDGSTVPLRRPRLRMADLAFGPLDATVLTSLRMGPGVFGAGLLDAVPEAALEALAAEQAGRGDAIRGQVNRVWDVAAGRLVAGRFGLKANQPNLRQQIAAAFHGDLGITSALFPDANCPEAQSACRRAEEGPQPELSAPQLDAITAYLRALAPPPRRNADDPAVRQGEALFAALACAACHRPTLTSGPVPGLPQISGTRFAPYSDLLLHDLGPELADGRPDFAASGRQWRTAPLWGLGLVAVIADQPAFLHDGRARTPLEAILWHGGEARAAREAFAAMPAAERAALLAFLESL